MVLNMIDIVSSVMSLDSTLIDQAKGKKRQTKKKQHKMKVQVVHR